MADVVWDSNFEASPANTDEAKYGASKIRELKVAIRERVELEHDIDTGKHLPGLSGFVYVGTTTEINALTGMSEGALAFDTTVNSFKYYYNEEWTTIQLDHSTLANLDDAEHTLDPHPQYLKLNKEGQTITQNLAVADGVTIDGIDLSEDEGKLDAMILTSTNRIDLTFVASSKEIRRSGGSFITDGFAIGDIIYSTSTNNPGPFAINTISATSIVVYDSLSDEVLTLGTLFTHGKGLGAWGGTYVVDTIYGPEVRDCFIRANGSSINGVIYGYADNTTNPTTLVSQDSTTLSSAAPASVLFPVRKGQYWKISQTGISGLVISRMEIS